MLYLPLTIAAYLLNAVAVTIDKILLIKHIPDPLIYVFYFSLVSCLALFLIPFASLPSGYILLLASVSTVLWTVGAYFMLKALKIGQISRVIPVIGTLIPLFLLIVGIKTGTLTQTEIYAVVTLVLGLVFITLLDWKGRIDKKEIALEIGSAFFFAISYLLLRYAYESSNFWTVFVYSRPVLIPLGILLILVPVTRKIIFPGKTQPYWKSFLKSNALWLFASGQVAAGVSQLLLIFSISLASPALVNALQGIQYAFLFIAAFLLSKKFPQVFKEKMSATGFYIKALGIIFISFGLYLLTKGA
ncbi:hypothetical protein HYS97_01670 [Candidatus Daviesbacteria bacterium]|nr:hypothetical protein [Candidatus Daviesbacteria bacterium]